MRRIALILLASTLVIPNFFVAPAGAFHGRELPAIHEETGTGPGWYAATVRMGDGAAFAVNLETTGPGPVQFGFALTEENGAFDGTRVAESFEPGTSITSSGEGTLPGGSYYIGGGSGQLAMAGLEFRHDAPEPLVFRLVFWTSGAYDTRSWAVRGDAQVEILDASSGDSAFLHTLSDFEHTGAAADVPVAGERVLVEAEKRVHVERALYSSFHLMWSCPTIFVCAPTTGTISWEGPGEQGEGRAQTSTYPLHLVTGSGWAEESFIRNGAPGEYAFRVDSDVVGHDRFLLGGADVTLPPWP